MADDRPLMPRRARPFITPAEADRARRLSAIHTHRTVCELTGISSSTLCELKKRGFRSAQRGFRPVPNDWGIVAPDLTSTELQRHYRAGPSTIKRWFRERAVPRPKGGPPAFPIPSDLAETLAAVGQAGAAAHYGVSRTLVYAWRKKLSLDVAGQSTLGWEEHYRRRAATSFVRAIG